MTETTTKGSSLGVAVMGGVIGAVLTAAVLVFATPQFLSRSIVRQGMLADPQILVEASDALRDRQTAPLIASSRSALETPFASSWKGAEKPEVVLVEFYDYACPYCKASNPHVDRLLKEKPGLRVVYRELPILGPDSVAAARVSLAASKAGRFARFHDTLHQAGNPSPETVAIAGNAAAVTPEQARDPAIEAEIENNYRLAGQLGASGTPLFVIGNQVINSAVGYQGLKEAVAKARAAKG